MNKNNKGSSSSLSETLVSSGLTFEYVLAAFMTSFMLSYVVQLLHFPEFSDLSGYYNAINFPLFFLLAIIFTILLLGLTLVLQKKSVIPRSLITLTTILSVTYAVHANTKDVYFIIGLAVVCLAVVLWCVKDDKLELSKINISHKVCFFTACVLFVFTSVLFSYLTSLRYQNFANATFDFGVFAQMFERMATTGAPLTTVERSVELSHFGVHFSPFFYLLLPLYYIFRSPVYLIWAQAVSVALGVFPVYLICKKLGLSGKVTLAFELIYSFYPCLFNGCFYDFHENKFLTTIILFLFYFILCEKRWLTYAFSLLLLSVKEDAAIYLIVIALFVLLSAKKNENKTFIQKYLDGFVMLSMALVYFVIANKVVSSLGTEGVMMWRLSDYFVNGEESYFSVLKGIIFNVGHLLSQMFTAEKFPFLIWMFLPLMFTPFAQKKISTLILLLPIIPINLMQSWEFQYDVDFQYTYGVAALIIFCALIGVKNLKGSTKRVALLMSLIMCATISTHVISPKITNNLSYEKNYSSVTKDIDKMLREIEKDKSVTASHYVMPHLYFIEEIYTVPDYYKELEQTDYYVVDTRYADGVEEMTEAMGDDYTLVSSSSFVEVYKRNY
ncbi:MAG: DUF2079 domain-containing protein [Ruminococcus sp.]|nr:DUF2079 domain-containing protein [Ruminococcus sp.]